MKTAYEEALDRINSGESTESDIPSYMIAADSLNIRNNNPTFIESAADTVSSVPKFIGVSLISGVNQLYNIPADIGNLFGGEFERSDTSKIIHEVDEELGEFYTEHQEGADVVGFIASSLVPGLGSVKLLKAGQRSLSAAVGGKVSPSMGKALGLLAPQRQKYLDDAISEVFASSGSSLINRNAIKAVGAGFGQNVLEAAAFEVGVAATLFNSPILEEQDFGDLLTNIAFGAGVFGVIGGAVDTARTTYAIRRAAADTDIAARPWKFIEEPAPASTLYEKIALDFEQLAGIPEIPKDLPGERQAFLKAAADTKKTKLNNRIRGYLGELSNGDQAVATSLFDAFKTANVRDQQAAFIGLAEVTRFADSPALEKQLGKLSAKINVGRASAEEIEKFSMLSRSYVKMWGEDAGKVTTDIPVITSVVDLLKKGEIIKISDVGIQVGERKFGFSLDYNIGKPGGKPWNVMHSDPLEANARYIWLQKTKLPEIKEGSTIRVHQFDIPLMEKLYKELPEDQWHKINIKLADGGTVKTRHFPSFRDFIRDTKEEVANRLERATAAGDVISDAEVAANKVRSMLGIRFAVSDRLEPGTNAMFSRPLGDKGTSSIIVDKKYLTTTPLHKIVDTILHEEGHSRFQALLDSGYDDLATITGALKEELIAVSKKRRPSAWAGTKEGTEYYEYLNKHHELMADALAYFGQRPEQLLKEAPLFTKEFGHLVRPLSKELVDSYSQRAAQLTQDEIAAMVNVRTSYLSGEVAADIAGADKQIFALQSFAEEYTQRLINQGSRKISDGPVDIWNIPQHSKLTYDMTPFEGFSNHVLENMVIIKEQQRLYTEAQKVAAASVLGEDYAKLPDITREMIYNLASRIGAGAKFLGAASNNYGSLGATVEFIGHTTARMIEKHRAAASEVLDPYLYKLAQNQEAAIEWANLNATIRSIEEHYILTANGAALEPLKIARWRKAAQEATAGNKQPPKRPELAHPDTPLLIPIKHDETRQLAKAHIELNGARTQNHAVLKSAKSMRFNRDPESFYPLPVDPRDYPYFAIVTDESITGVGHSKTLYAATEKELTIQVNKLKQNPHLKIRTKGEAEDYYKSIGQYDADKTLNDNYIDITARRAGVSAPYIIPTDVGKITSDTINWHLQRETALVREAVISNYEVSFEELRRLGDEFTATATSKFSSTSLLKHADDVVKNPYVDYIKTALNLRKTADYPFWIQANRLADDAVSKMFNAVTGAVEGAKNSEELAAVNGMLERAGYKGAAYDESMELFANARPQRGTLTVAIQKANSILATVVLRLDFLNSVNNAVSANVLLGAETKAVIRAIERGDEEAVGALALLTKIKVPGTEHTVFAPQKLIANSMRKFGLDTPEMQFYKDHGFVTTISRQYRDTLDELTYNPQMSVEAWSKRIDDVHEKLRKAADTGEKWTGNRLAEEFNRFVAADVMKQMTDVAVARKLMSKQEQLAYINTFVNRTQGNYLAAQRPMLFQGPIGQSIGLFQTYQFNLMQQLLRHVGEGHAKDGMTLLALQGTIHGMNGLPAFNAINTHIIGTASGNTEHRDVYDTVYGIVGKDAGDWLMYGMASNALGLIDPDLKINLYTRGDINPRHVTIIPTDPQSIPIVQASARFFSNLFETAGKLKAGGDVTTTLLQGIAHNGISRPLAGLAQTLQGLDNPYEASYSTSRRGNVIASNDILSLANLGRIAGGKPLDEAIALDATYRYKAYGLYDSKKRSLLGKAIKTTLIAGKEPSQEQIEQFAQKYVEGGGRIQEFNSWFGQLYKNANLSQANALRRGLNSPFSQSMQKIMGGRELRDFSNSRDVRSPEDSE